MSLQSGSMLGPYEIVAALGRGGMGEVYRARDNRLDRDVALKILPTQFSGNDDALGRFQREAKVLAGLRHPNIVSVYDVGNESGIAFVVLELLEGETLGDRLAESAMDWWQCLSLVREVADGLAAAHAKGVVHRDLKPENIFLTSDGRAKILDFGLARALTDRPQTADAQTQTCSTQPGTVLGTPAYMSPEQVRGCVVDARSDVFSFGCVLYHMLSGGGPFVRSTSSDSMAAVLNESPPDLSSLGHPIPHELQRVVDRCLDKDPALRFQSARELSSALVACETGASRRSFGRGPAAKLCVCGRSKSPPLCDGSHAGEHWTCAQESERAPVGFCASQRYQNLAYKLASHYQAALCLPGRRWPAVDRLIMIVDGTDLDFSLSVQHKVDARERVVFSVGIVAGLLQRIFEHCQVVDLGDVSAFEAFRRVQNALDGPSLEMATGLGQTTLRSAFVCHAVKDEPLILPVMSYVRHHFGTDIFLSFDSIHGGANLQRTILGALGEKECFVGLLSAAANASSCCAFEIGAACALEKPIKFISLDGCRAPDFVQHAQVIDLPRLVKQKPWLDIQDVLLHGLLNVLSECGEP